MIRWVSMVARMPGKRAVENFYWSVAHLGIVLIKYISKKKMGKIMLVFYNCVELNTIPPLFGWSADASFILKQSARK